MSSSKISMELRSSLMSTGLVQPVSYGDKPKRFWVLCRQVPGQEKAWLELIEKILLAFETAEWDGDKPEIIIARRYVVKDGRMVYGWYIDVIAKNVNNLELAVLGLIANFNEAKPSLAPPTPRQRARQEVVQEEDFEEDEPQAAPQRKIPLAAGQHPANMKPRPRIPDPVVDRPAPTGFKPSIRVVKTERDAKGAVHVVEEMPLPHVYKEMNVPTAKDKGAKYIG